MSVNCHIQDISSHSEIVGNCEQHVSSVFPHWKHGKQECDLQPKKASILYISALHHRWENWTKLADFCFTTAEPIVSIK